MKKVYLPSGEAGAPLSGAYEVNGLVFVSGQVHMHNGQLIGNTIEEKLSVIIANIQDILNEAGLGLNDIIKVTLYLTDMSQLPALNKVYINYFQHPLPARTAVGVSSLPLGAGLEMEVVASRT